jgi:glyoxylase-like metal-dependent hydrolase (beta-lactamase superfamily II)
MLPLVGHSRGHSAIALEGEGGWLLHAGDAYFDHGEVHLPERRCPALLRLFQTIVEVDRKARLGNQARLRELCKSAPEVTVFSAHDPRELGA